MFIDDIHGLVRCAEETNIIKDRPKYEKESGQQEHIWLQSNYFYISCLPFVNNWVLEFSSTFIDELAYNFVF